jgi:hypothetical protein
MTNEKKEPKMETRITRLTVLPKGEPIFSEQATHIEIDDEAAGEFVAIKQMGGNTEHEKILVFNPEEWAEVKKAVDQMFKYIALNENEGD